ncbi:type I toxin-antitoxin system Fst family toxin [Mammaliicoccus sciuri]
MTILFIHIIAPIIVGSCIALFNHWLKQREK